MTEIPDDIRDHLSRRAWAARERSRVLGDTKVGCAVLDQRGEVSVGCNVEHRFRSHDIHAEVSAASSMVTAGGERLVAVFIAAAREKFTPCGACIDWIFELGGEGCIVFTQREEGGAVAEYTAAQLMPHYPR